MEVKPKVRKLSRAEIVLAVIAAVVVTGWVFSWLYGGRQFDLFRDWFASCSFFAALLLLVFVALKPFALLSLPPRIESKVVPVLSLIPVLGYLISTLATVYSFFTIGGSIALAYVAATVFWRKQLEFAEKTVAVGVRESLERPEAAHKADPKGEKPEESATAEDRKDAENSAVSST